MTQRSLLPCAIILCAACVGSGPTPPAAQPAAEPGSAPAQAKPAPIVHKERPFAADSPFNVPIVDSPRIDPKSAEMVAQLARKKGMFSGLYEFAIPIFDATQNAPRAKVRCKMDPAWGSCAFKDQLIPFPEGAHPHTGSDGAMVVVDWEARKSYEFWQVQREATDWVTSWGAVSELDGPGFGKNGSSTAAGASRLGGVIRVHEIEAGKIEHALVVATDNSCATDFRPPAVKTDGPSSRPDCVPQGARLQLDPSIDLSTLSGLTRGERIVAEAMQKFGAYVIDKGGAPLSVSFELARDAQSPQELGAVYEAAGLDWDYYDMPHLPWDRLRVLRGWNGS